MCNFVTKITGNMELTYQQIPTGWPLCFLKECVRKGECLRYRAGLAIPADLQQTLSVTPSVLKGPVCPMFRKIETMRVAVGFSRIFREVKQRHASQMRAELTAYLGGNGTYYRYLHGHRALSPEQQAWIAELFRGYGYTEEVVFDAYEERFRFYND